MALSYKEMQDLLMKELRLYHYPIAVNFFYDDASIQRFKETTPYVKPVKPMTYCQWEIAARMKGETVLAYPEDLGCSNARVSFGFADIDEKEIKSHLKYCKDLDQAERFLRSKPRFPMNKIKAIAVGSLGKAKIQPDLVHFYCDNMQSYHLVVDYMAAMDIHPMRSCVSMNSAACSGSAYSFLEQVFNMGPACSGSYNAGKTERGELNVFIPGSQIEAVVNRLLDRVNTTSSAITRPGDGFPGADICKNCPLIIFKKGDDSIPAECASCNKQ